MIAMLSPNSMKVNGLIEHSCGYREINVNIRSSSVAYSYSLYLLMQNSVLSSTKNLWSFRARSFQSRTADLYHAQQTLPLLYGLLWKEWGQFFFCANIIYLALLLTHYWCELGVSKVFSDRYRFVCLQNLMVTNSLLSPAHVNNRQARRNVRESRTTLDIL
jgi:hypothetical protein